MSTFANKVFANAAKIGGPFGAAAGTISDFAAPLAPFSMILTIVGIFIIAISGAIWFAGIRKALRRQLAEAAISEKVYKEKLHSNVWMQVFSFSLVGTVVMGFFWIGGMIANDMIANNEEENRGLLANIPAIENLQQQLFQLEATIVEEGEKTRAVLENVNTTLEEGFAALARQDSIIDNPQTAAEFYHNAKLQIQVGDNAGARRSLESFLRLSADNYLDPYLEYVRILKAEEGPYGAIETLNALAAEGLSYELAKLTLRSREQRIAGLQQMVDDHPEYGPAWWMLAKQFDPQILMPGTVAELRQCSDYYQQFQTADQNGQFYRYFLYKPLAEEWRETARETLNELAKMERVEHPVRFKSVAMSTGWILQFTVLDAVENAALQFGEQGEMTAIEPTITRGEAEFIYKKQLASDTQAMPIVFEYTDINGVTASYSFDFDPALAAVAQMQKRYDTLGLKTFASLSSSGRELSFRGAQAHDKGQGLIQAIHYSVDSDALDKSWQPGDDARVSLPKTTEYIEMEIVLRDGTRLGPDRLTPLR